MRIGIVSDIHCNAPGLLRAIELMSDEVDEIICAGDTVYEFRFSDEVVEILRKNEIRTVLGNHEAVVLGPQGERARSNPAVNQDNVSWLAQQPYRIDTRVNGKRLLMVHGSPFEPWNEYIFPHTPSFKKLADLESETDYVVLGHTHQAMAERSGRVLVINPGSTGEARDPRIGFQLSYAILDTQSDEVRIELFPDPQREARGLPPA